MNKLFYVLAILISSALISCSNGSGSDSDKGYVDPDLDESKTLVSKSYTLGTFSCTSSTTCGAIIFQGELKDVEYAGFAAGKDSENSNFTLKVYWEADSITSVNLPSSSYSIIINDGNCEYTSTSDNLNVTISGNSGSTIYTITFNEAITVSDDSSNTFTIIPGNTITAYRAD